MGKFIKGILGGFSGKIGNVIGAYHRGVDYMRSLPRKSSKAATLPQLNQRMRFKTVMGFLRPIVAFIRVGYQMYKGTETPFNAAVAYHLENAVTGVYPNLVIDFAEVRLSKGDLLQVYQAEVSTEVGHELKLDWLNNAGPLSPELTDEATVVVYNPMKDLFVALQGAAVRSALTYTLALPGDFVGDQVHVYMYFVGAKRSSDSVYLGAVTVIA